MRYAFIKDNVVVDCFGVDPFTIFSPNYAQQFVQVPDNVDVGWRKSGSTYSPPPAPSLVPQSVTMRQARLALLGAGVLHHVDTVLDALEEPTRSAAQIEWEYAATVDRHSSLTDLLGPSLGLDDATVDQLFISAAAL